MSKTKKIRSHPLNNCDENHNFEKTNPGLGYSTLTKTISIPNVLISTLQIAASESTIDPIKTSNKHPSVSAFPSMAERRRGKVFAFTPVLLYGSPYMATVARTLVYGFPYIELLNKHLTSVKSEIPNGQQSVKARVSPVDHPILGRQKKVECLPKDIQSFEKLCFHGSDSISKIGKSRYDTYKVRATTCICKRERKIVWCVMCGYHTEGNVLMTCPVHKRVLYGMYVCGSPMCKAPRHLVEKDW